MVVLQLAAIKFSEKQAALDKVLDLNGRFIPGYDMKAEMLCDSHRYREALDLINRPTNLPPSAEMVQIQSRICQAQGDIENAIKVLQNQQQLQPYNRPLLQSGFLIQICKTARSLFESCSSAYPGGSNGSC